MFDGGRIPSSAHTLKFPAGVKISSGHFLTHRSALNTGRLGSTIVNLSVPGEFAISRRGDACDAIQVCSLDLLVSFLKQAII